MDYYQHPNHGNGCREQPLHGHDAPEPLSGVQLPRIALLDFQDNEQAYTPAQLAVRTMPNVQA
jgi:hypothetical protein